MTRNPYEFPEKPCFMIHTFIKSFEEKRPIICHKDRQLTIENLLYHGYCRRIKPNEEAVKLFKQLKCGEDLPESFKYLLLPDKDINNYEFFELTPSGTTAVYYYYQKKELKRFYKDKIKNLKGEILELISNKFKEL